MFTFVWQYVRFLFLSDTFLFSSNSLRDSLVLSCCLLCFIWMFFSEVFLHVISYFFLGKRHKDLRTLRKCSWLCCCREYLDTRSMDTWPSIFVICMSLSADRDYLSSKCFSTILCACQWLFSSPFRSFGSGLHLLANRVCLFHNISITLVHTIVLFKYIVHSWLMLRHPKSGWLNA